MLPNIPADVERLYLTFKEAGHTPPIRDLVAVVSSIISNATSEILVILDALDEVPERSSRNNRQELLQFLSGLAREGFSRLHVLVTSRDLSDIRHPFREVASQELCLERSDVDPDIRYYVQCCLKHYNLARWSPDLKSEIEEIISSKAKGMFRWAACQMELIERCRKIRDARIALSCLPKTLDDTYKRMLADINEEYLPDAMAVFRWLTYSRRPLSIEEIAEAAILQSETTRVDPNDRLADPSEVIGICRGLLTLSHEQESHRGPKRSLYHQLQLESRRSRVVRFSHFSVQEYLRSERASSFHIDTAQSHTQLTGCCLSDVIYNASSTFSIEDTIEYPMLEYAARYWHEHFQNLEASDPQLDGLVHMLLETDALGRWLQIHDPVGLRHYSPSIVISMQGPAWDLFYASHLGLYRSTKRSLYAIEDSNITRYIDSGVTPYTALGAACLRGHVDIVRLLLSRGADPNSRIVDGTILKAVLDVYQQCIDPVGESAKLKNMEEVLLILLEHGAETKRSTQN
ncbi:hypothetical protein BDV96DRAFT_607594 [Lophiotrema nucula]|uniref:Nephrocystin 3-like N-terminal domain-containing protein n=1 Tax=Lophiotrema nucula TaxID=690887 RepID=A0A6A5YIR8_9PLEO|nr:hypothetical protein BDV96DRAFT_607594 [Lophiotrema nucula]